jgi:beta-N-acetylhexosaminidase
VPAIDYDLIEALAPDPDQVIQLQIVGDQAGIETEETAGGYGVGDVINVKTSVIRDLNGNPVPDGTIVRFDLVYQSDPNTVTAFEATTTAGEARTDIALDRIGQLTITAESDPARTSELLQLNVQEGVRAFVTVIAPTALPTAPVEPTETPQPASPTPIPDAAVSPDAEPPAVAENERGYGALQLVLGVMGLGLVAVVGLIARRNWHPLAEVSEARIVLTSVVAGLLVYNYLALGLPGSEILENALGMITPMFLSMVGAAVGVAMAYLARKVGAESGLSAG